ncbi:hypothetical protein KA005_40990, partial [bacterium]|nr:hypothetical protein [bacterium]
ADALMVIDIPVLIKVCIRAHLFRKCGTKKRGVMLRSLLLCYTRRCGKVVKITNDDLLFFK